MNHNETAHLAPYLHRVFIIGKDRYKIEQLGNRWYVTRFHTPRDGFMHYADIYFAFALGFNYTVKVFNETYNGTLLFAQLQFTEAPAPPPTS